MKGNIAKGYGTFLRLMAVTAVAATTTMCTTPKGMSEIQWETLGNRLGADGQEQHLQRFTVIADGSFERMAFCSLIGDMKPTNPLDTVVEILPGYYAVGSPRFAALNEGDTVVVELMAPGTLHNQSFIPDGMHLVRDGKAVRATNVRQPIVMRPEQWRSPVGKDPMIYGDRAFVINDSLRTDVGMVAYKQVPVPKSVELTGRKIAKPTLKVEQTKDSRNDYYRVEIDGGTATIYTNSKYPEAIKAMVQRRIDQSADADGRVVTAKIEDWADYAIRGYMIDVARNFQSKEDVKSHIDLMARYGLNFLHFHLGDDEGWRLEIPSLPELTEVGARRGYTTTDDVPFLKGIYSGDGNPDAKDTPANGFYTVDEFIEILKYAESKGILVMPEFDTPGHSRAAIRSMEWRAKHNGDSSYRLIEDGDTSVYSTAQFFHDNIMNPALNGPYKFMATIFDGIIAIYKKAGVELPGIHIGGDEVAEHAWDGSPAVNALRKREGMTTQKQVFAHFVRKVSELASQRGIKIGGWQEIALGNADEYDKAVQPTVMYVNSWTNADTKGKEMAAKDYPLIISNVDYLYFDQTPSTHPEEPGFTWGGIVDDLKPLHATVEHLFPGDTITQEKAAGISGTTFAETVRSRAMYERYMLPRLLGLAERAHSRHATITDQHFYAILNEELPLLAKEGHNILLRQPGIKIQNGMVTMNTAYAPGLGQIRYTTDGTLPTADSPVYTAPFTANGIKEIRARLFMGKAQSVISILYNYKKRTSSADGKAQKEELHHL